MFFDMLVERCSGMGNGECENKWLWHLLYEMNCNFCRSGIQINYTEVIEDNSEQFFLFFHLFKEYQQR